MRRAKSLRRAGAGLLGLAAAAALAVPAPAGAASAQQSHFLSLADSGVASAQQAFADASHGLWNGKRNVPIHWYDEVLGSHAGYPLATIWGSVPVFESLSAIATADPTAANRTALATFAFGSPTPAAAGPKGFAARATARPRPRHHKSHQRPILKGAEAYWDAAVKGYAPYPGDRGKPNVWFDDNAWWGLAFLDAYHALGTPRLLQDAQNAFSFIAHEGWDSAGGGMWWNTAHTPPGQKSGEPLAAGSLLGVELAQALRAAGNPPTAASDLQTSENWLAWGDAHFAAPNGLYWRTGDDPTPTPYITGPVVEAKQLLCTMASHDYCTQAARLADAAEARFADRLNMGPQFDVNYLHWMLAYGQQTGDQRWAALAKQMADNALANSKDPKTGLYERAWDGSDMSGHQAGENMLRTDAATVELFGWLAADGP